MGKVVLVMTSGERIGIDDAFLGPIQQKMGEPVGMWGTGDVGSRPGVDQIVPAHITRIQRIQE